MHMLFGVITHKCDHRESNLGDDIQAVAAGHLSPRVDLALERESLDSCTQDVFAIMNGWYMHHPERFPPSPTIRPHITSVHITPSISERLLTEPVVQYFRAHGPVGCRDRCTEQLLKKIRHRGLFQRLRNHDAGQRHLRQPE